MGDYSRDTFKLTNVMHHMLTGESVTNSRQYMGVRLQQGVPLLDADFNELDDIRKAEVRSLLHYFIGNGVPVGDQGFEISGSGAANDFTIGAGVILLQGWLVFNPVITTYGAQSGAPVLNTPGGGTDRSDLVYLDVWEEEVAASDGTQPDARIVNTQIGIETARRLERRWLVRVAEGVDDIATLVPPPGHHFTALAVLERHAGVAAVNDSMVIDQRRLGITLAENLKIPLYLRRGAEIIDGSRFAQMLNGLRTTLFDRLRDDNLPYQTAAPDAQRKENLIFMALQELMHLCQIGENQSLSGVMNNADALNFLEQLYEAQHHWLDVLADLGNDANVAQIFLDDYDDYLEGAGAIDGLRPALDDDNLLFAVLAQEAIGAWLSAPTDNLPEGGVDALYASVVPYANLTAGQPYVFTYNIEANFTSPLADEDFQIQVTLNGAFGTAVASDTLVTFSTPEDSETITVTVTPSGSLASANLLVRAVSVRNPSALRSTQPPILLELNQLPPVASFYFYAGAAFNINGRLVIAQNLLTQVVGYTVLCKLRNTSAAAHTYNITAQVVPNVADDSGWIPLSATPVSGSPFNINGNGEADVFVNIRASDPGNIPAVGTTGEVISVATIDGLPDTVTVTVPFIVGNPTS